MNKLLNYYIAKLLYRQNNITIKQYNNNRGFSFVELILYVSILTIMLSAIIPFAWDVIGSGVKSATQQEVSTQARYISERIKYEIRNATGIQLLMTPVIVLNTSNPATNPTIIARSGNNIIIQQGSGGQQVQLNSNNTTVTNIIFTNYTSSDLKTKNIQFSFDVNASFGSTNQKYTKTVSMRGDAEVRSN